MHPLCAVAGCCHSLCSRWQRLHALETLSPMGLGESGSLWAAILLMSRYFHGDAKALFAGLFHVAGDWRSWGSQEGSSRGGGAGGKRGWLAADPRWWWVRLQKGEMVKPWIYQESGICAICLLLIKSSVVCILLLMCSPGCWQWPYPVGDPRLCFLLSCNTAVFDSITFYSTANCSPWGLLHSSLC